MRQICVMIAVVVVAILLPGCDKSATAPIPDSKLEKALIGTWRSVEADSTGSVLAHTTYLPNGKASVVGTFKSQGSEERITIQMTWHVTNGYLYTTTESSKSATHVFPVGAKTANKIVSITNDEFTFIQGVSGKTKVWGRPTPMQQAFDIPPLNHQTQ